VTRILFHELTHALDDQHHDISRFVPGGAYEDDRLEAVRAVVEGSAVNSELDYQTRLESGGERGTVLENEDLPRYGGFLKPDGTPAPREHEGLAPQGQRMMPSASPGQMPAVIGKTMVFPYAYGFEFIRALRAGDVPVDRAFEDPPRSTEQIIHPEKYLAAEPDEPTRVRFASLEDRLAAHGVILLAERTLGEFLIRCVLEDVETADGAGAAAGWDGDRLAIVTAEGALGFLWASTWDTETDAEEFARAAGEYSKAKLAGRSVSVRRSDRDVLVTSVSSPCLREALALLEVGHLVVKTPATTPKRDTEGR
jgi:hypothetical protein